MCILSYTECILVYLQNQIGGFYCDCIEGYTGDRCDEDMDECVVYSPCGEDGTCTVRYKLTLYE